MTHKADHWREKIRVGPFTILVSSYDGLVSMGYDIDIEPIPDFGIYFDECWREECTDLSYFHKLIKWPDKGTIGVTTLKETINIIIDLLKSGKKVEIGCIGGHGRTGTVLACLLIKLEHLKPEIAINAIRERYCSKAIETYGQEQLVTEYYKLDNRA